MATMDIEKAEQLTKEIDRLVAEIAPNSGRRKMYGGIVFEAEPGNPKTSVCGHFISKNHVSLEFSQGIKLSDERGSLEGKGKTRRHLKLMKLSDIHDKDVRHFLEAAFKEEASK